MKFVRPNANRAGFTLVEVLVVLAVLGFIMSLTTTVLHLASRSLIIASLRDNRSEMRAMNINALRRLLTQVQPDFIKTEGNFSHSFFGTENRIEFLAPLLERFGAEDMVRYVLYIGEDGILHLAWHLDRPAGDPSIAADDPLFGTSNASFSYFGAGGGENSGGWSNLWKNRSGLPIAIHLRFDLNKQSVNMIVPLIIGRNL